MFLTYSESTFVAIVFFSCIGFFGIGFISAKDRYQKRIQKLERSKSRIVYTDSTNSSDINLLQALADCRNCIPENEATRQALEAARNDPVSVPAAVEAYVRYSLNQINSLRSGGRRAG